MRINLSIILSFIVFCLCGQEEVVLPVWNQKEVHAFFTDASILYFKTGDQTSYAIDQGIKVSDVIFKDQDLLDLKIDANTLFYQDQKLVLPSTITKVFKTESGSFYIGTENGLYYSDFPFNLVAKRFYRIDIPDLGYVNGIFEVDNHYLFCDSSHLILWNHKLESLDVLPNNLGQINDIHLDDYGLLWFGSERGLSRYNLLQVKNDEPPILNVEPLGQRSNQLLEEEIVIDSNDVVAYQVTGAHPIFQEEVQCHYHLKGSNVDRKGEIPKGLFILKDLNPGEYSLRFSTGLKGRKQSSFSKIISINVKGTKSNMIWWITFGGIGSLFLLWSMASNRDKRFYKDIVGQRDKLVLENKALKFEQEALRLQMNPHFIFNVLNSINGMIAIGDQKNARKYINEFSQLMRTVLHQSRSEFIELESEMAYLEKYLSLEKVTRNEGFDYYFDLQEGIDKELKILPMIIQPFLENSIIHGFKKMDRRAKLTVKFLQREEFIEVEIEDNGVGRIAKKDTLSHQSVGLKVVKERLGNKFGYRFVDLKDNLGAAIGTKVIIKMPYK